MNFLKSMFCSNCKKTLEPTQKHPITKVTTSPKIEMPQLKLTYFDLRNRGEPIRLILHYAGIQFEDNRIQPADWPSKKGRK